MPRLPQPGGDDGSWGAILNDFLAQSHDTDGSLKAGAVGASAIADTTITEAKLSSAVQTKLNTVAPVTSVNSQTGAVILTKTDVGLGNVDNTSDATKDAAAATLTNKTISGASNTLSSIPQSAVTNLTSDLTAKADDSAVVHDTGNETVAGIKTFSSSPVVPSPSAGPDVANKTYVDSVVGGGGPVLWGGISGTLGDQSDLQAALNAKADDTTTVNGQALSSNVTLTKSDVGLGNADNTSDANKPISSATQTALNAKADTSALSSYVPTTEKGAANGVATLDGTGKVPSAQLPASGGAVTSVASRTGDVVLSKNDVGLGNVDNTSDANKPVSSATQTALNGKADTTHAHAGADITSGTVASARLGSGTANGTTFLRGDGTWATPSAAAITYADVPAGSTFTVYKTAAGSWPGARPSARTDIYFIFKGPGTAGTGTSPESIMIDGDDWQILP